MLWKDEDSLSAAEACWRKRDLERRPTKNVELFRGPLNCHDGVLIAELLFKAEFVPGRGSAKPIPVNVDQPADRTATCAVHMNEDEGRASNRLANAIGGGQRPEKSRFSGADRSRQ
jgi:hypothetical protein